MKTGNAAIYALLFLTFFSSTLVGDENIPLDSAILVEKLTSFEAEERAKFVEVLSEKTNEVIEILQSHLERETKSGNLERAIALREEIKRLSKAVALSAIPGKGVKIPEDAKRFRDSGYYILSIQKGGMNYIEAMGLAREKGGKIFAPRSRQDVEAMFEIVRSSRCWVSLRWDQETKKLIPDGENGESFGPEEIGIKEFEFNPGATGLDIYLATNGSGGFKLAPKKPVVKNAVLAVMIYFEKS